MERLTGEQVSDMIWIAEGTSCVSQRRGVLLQLCALAARSPNLSPAGRQLPKAFRGGLEAESNDDEVEVAAHVLREVAYLAERKLAADAARRG